MTAVWVRGSGGREDSSSGRARPPVRTRGTSGAVGAFTSARARTHERTSAGTDPVATVLGRIRLLSGSGVDRRDSALVIDGAGLAVDIQF